MRNCTLRSKLRQKLVLPKALTNDTLNIDDETIKIVSDLIPQLNALEEIAKADRSKLAPEIHDGVRGMQMQSAYQRNR